MLTTFSYSRLDSFRNCPRKFKFRYIDKVETPKEVSVNMQMGTAVHAVLEELHKHGHNGVCLTVEQAKEIYHAEWEKVKPELFSVRSSFYTVDDYIRMGEEMLKTYYERYQPFKDGVLLGTELNLRFQIPGTEKKITGFLDRLVKRDDGVVEICDYKTGQKLPRPKDQNYFFQMGIYQLAVMENYPQFKEIELAQYILSKDEVVRYKMTPEDMDELGEQLRQAVVAVGEAERLNEFPVNETGLCDWCEYHDICPAKVHKLLLTQEEEATEAGVPHVAQGQKLAEEFIKAQLARKQAVIDEAALKERVVQFAAEHGYNALEGETGNLSIKTMHGEKFITKTDDQKKFVQLSILAHEIGLEEFFKLDQTALMREIYKKRKMTDEQMEALGQFVVPTERVDVRVRKRGGGK